VSQENPNYTYQISWSDEDHEFVATCLELPGLLGLGESEAEALTELKHAIAGWLEHLRSEGLPLPVPLANARAHQRR
jgi:predicted RNase H-like HicB family nuclease